MDQVLYFGLSFLTAVFCVLLAYAVSRRPECFVSLPRLRWAGAVIGVPCLAWCAWHGCLMLEGPLSRFHALAWFLVPVTAVLSWKFLDYLFARSLGGFFILSANELIRQSFAQGASFRPLYSAVCLLIGIAGLFLLGVPWRMRDCFTLASTNKSFARLVAGLLVFAALLFIALPVCK